MSAKVREVTTTMISISKSVRLAKSQDGAVLLDVEQGTMFSLNPVGARIIELLGQEQSFSSLVAQVSEDFGVSGEVIEPDVDEFLSSLRKQRLLNEHDTEQQIQSR